MSELAVGDKVTVRTSNFDPVHLQCSPFTRVVEVGSNDEGDFYYVGHDACGPYFPATRFGPFRLSKLKPGW